MKVTISPINHGFDVCPETEKECAFLIENEKEVYNHLSKYFFQPVTKAFLEEVEKDLNCYYNNFNYKNDFWDNKVEKI